MKYEVQLWLYQILKYIPGVIGCHVRNLFLPYRKGRDVRVMDGVQLDKPSMLTMGDRVSINRGTVLNSGGGITIGNNVMIGPNVIVYSQNHAYSCPDVPFIDQGYNYKPVIIGNNVWIGASAIVLPGVTVGENSVIAAGSVVTKSIEPGSLVGGNPARVIKKVWP